MGKVCLATVLAWCLFFIMSSIGFLQVQKLKSKSAIGSAKSVCSKVNSPEGVVKKN